MGDVKNLSVRNPREVNITSPDIIITHTGTVVSSVIM